MEDPKEKDLKGEGKEEADPSVLPVPSQKKKSGKKERTPITLSMIKQKIYDTISDDSINDFKKSMICANLKILADVCAKEADAAKGQANPSEKVTGIKINFVKANTQEQISRVACVDESIKNEREKKTDA